MDYEMDIEPTGPQVTVREVWSKISNTKSNYGEKRQNESSGINKSVGRTLPSRFQTQLRRSRLRQLSPPSHAC